MDDLTPFLRQYLEIKDHHRDAILFFRMGDFYEMFFDDAHIASKALEITLTSRGRMGDDPIPMAGVPHHAAESYIARMVDQGYKVAICEQVEDARQAKGIVKREVVQVVTPGVIVESGKLEAKSNNFLLGLVRHKKGWGIAYADISTGDFFISEPETLADVENELTRIEPRELVLPTELELDEEADKLVESAGCLVNYLEDSVFDLETARDLLLDQFEVKALDGFGCEGYSAGISAAGAVLHYLRMTRPGAPIQLDRLVPYETHDFMVLDEATKRNLELLRTLQEGKKSGSLLHFLDQSVTAMGGRLLRRWMTYPLLEVARIEARLDQVEALHSRAALRQSLRERLNQIADLERLTAKVNARSATPRDLVSLRGSLEQIPEISKIVAQSQLTSLERFARLDPCQELVELIARSIVDDPPLNLKDGGIIRIGFNAELDELIVMCREGKGFIAGLEAKERERTGINSLKVRYNKVFGYFIEVTRANLGAVPDHYIRKQTLTGSERFITQELKEYETKVLGAQERRVDLEAELFADVREQVAGLQQRIKQLAMELAELDASSALAEVAARYKYIRPQVDDSEKIDIEEGRHPVVERMMARERFVPNDVHLDTDQCQEVILTGPNMAGKSTIMRQVALIALMAQMGSFVPARKCRIGIVDRIFTRVGASDNLARGQSTFMVEMTETANILHFATRKSLVVLDEIGRGTSTFDGLSIAWAVAEMLHDNIGCKVLFATHYHELIDLALTKSRVRNFNVAVTEWGEQVVFMRKLKEGGASRSYGIQVARLAGLPKPVIERAREVLGNLERGELNEVGEPRLAKRRAPRNARRAGQLSLFTPGPSPLKEALLELDINKLTPLEALSQLADLQAMAQKE